MPGITAKRFHSTIRGPAGEALDILSARGAEILEPWFEVIRSAGIDPEKLVPVDTNFADLALRIRRESYPVLQQRFERYGEELAKKQIPLDQIVSIFNRLYEGCMRALLRTKRGGPVLAFSRLYASAGLAVLSGYKGEWTSGKKSLLEASIAEAETHSHDAAAYITRIYEQERKRLARDLHDEVGHDLVLIKLYLEMIELDTRGQDLPAVQPRVAEAIALLSHTIDAVRRIGLDLGPAVFDDLGFVPALRMYTNQFSSRTKIVVTLREGSLPEHIPMSHQVALYRVMQGALGNAMKHASAKNVRISLGSMKDSVIIMVIEDDGVGFDPKVKSGRGAFGLTAMRERVELLGGKFHIESRQANRAQSAHGTRIEIDIPLPGGDVE